MTTLPLKVDNVRVGLEAVLAHEEAVRRAVPKADLASARRLPELALAVAYANEHTSAPPPTGALDELAREGRGLRKLLLSSAKAAANAGLLEPQVVARIAAGRGAGDMASDCVALATLFANSSGALRGKTAITSAQIDRAAQVGKAWLALLKPAGARRAAAAPKEASVLRDRLWTLLVHGHEELWKLGALIYGFSVDDHVPRLTSSIRAKRAKAAPTPPPAATA